MSSLLEHRKLTPYTSQAHSMTQKPPNFDFSSEPIWPKHTDPASKRPNYLIPPGDTVTYERLQSPSQAYARWSKPNGPAARVFYRGGASR